MKRKDYDRLHEPLIILSPDNQYEWRDGQPMIVDKSISHQNYEGAGYPFGKTIRGFKKFKKQLNEKPIFWSFI